MSFLGGITEKIFGGTDNSAQKAQQQANQRSQEYIERMMNLGRGDANALYTQGDTARNKAINAAMALMGRSMPDQMRLFQQGNVAAQNYLSGGAPQYQNAILGMPVDYSAMKPTQLTLPDSSLYKQQLPNFGALPVPGQGQPWGTQPTQGPTAQGGPQGGVPQGGADYAAMLNMALRGIL